MAENFTAANATQSGGAPQTQTKVQPKTMYVHATSLNIREKASSAGTSLGKLLRGDKVDVVNITSDGWALLSTGKFVMAKAGKTIYLAEDKPKPLKKTAKPAPAPTASTPDQPPPPAQDTEDGPPVGMIVGGLAAVAVLYYFFTRK